MKKQQELFEDIDLEGTTIDLSSITSDTDSSDTVELHPWISVGGATMVDTITLGNGSGIYTTGNYDWKLDDISITPNHNSGKLKLEGDDADIEINGRSVMGILDSIEQRLGLLKCREDLEQEWCELKELGDRYRALQKQIEEKSKMWEALKKMPPPRID